MNTSDPAPAPSAAPPKDRTRLWAALTALLFLPAVVAVGVLTLASERASRCLTYGEQCSSSGLPEGLFSWSVSVAVVAFAVALVAPAVRVRQVALAVQAFAECAALLAVLSHA
ncbi:hypothetical protein ACH4SP_21270 [Streptomyces sp. NPDC021093]|uniref:hypothetical protein n=1 Tax=Streptomyces sp. NPDC021093 TaxID=3365112 RepID=UPI0037BCA9BC